MSSWCPPPGMTGDAGLVRASSRTARADERACPASAAAMASRACEMARGDTAAQSSHWAPFMTAPDLIEHRQVRQGPTLERAAEAEPGRLAAHPGLIEWTKGAVSRHLAAAPEMTVSADGSRVHLPTQSDPPPEKEV